MQERGRGAGALDRARGDEGAEGGRRDDRVLVGELLAAEALGAPPGQKAAAERVACADGVRDLDLR